MFVVGWELCGVRGCCGCMEYVYRLFLSAVAMVCCVSAAWCVGVPGGVPGGVVSGVVADCADSAVCVYAGSSLPYAAPVGRVCVPDSLEVLFVNHVGRHGARFLSSERPVASVRGYLDGCGGLTDVGRRLRVLCGALDSVTGGRWGALDVLGRVEQGGIGERFAERYGGLLSRNDSVCGFSSYVPRCVMSMDEMTHGVVWRNRGVELSTGSGRRFDALVRPFETDSAYLAYRESGEWSRVCRAFEDSVCPAAVVLRLGVRGEVLLERLREDLVRRGVSGGACGLEVALADTLAGVWPADWTEVCGLTKGRALELAGDVYKVVSGAGAVDYGADSLGVGVSACWGDYFSAREYERLWECGNLRHYLTYSANGLSEAPALMARGLLGEMTAALEAAAEPGYGGPAAVVRFGHAETMMPLLSLMGLPGCRYVTSDWGAVAGHWRDWDVVPMASNLQQVLCRVKGGGRLYLVTYRNECAVGSPEPWPQALMRLRESLCGGCGVSGR